MTIDELAKEAMSLAPEARANLASQLLSSLDELSDSEAERLWVEEAVRRDAELDSGSAKSSPVEDVIARARARRA
jgi:predicted transposase YdaD